ncbi:MAG: hypothetical protein NW202_13005 [Nitrospira sp.]|nr:hypothetical protein [Nitrospira sp.]
MQRLRLLAHGKPFAVRACPQILVNDPQFLQLLADPLPLIPPAVGLGAVVWI